MSSEISLLTRLNKKQKHMTGRRDRETQERKGKTEQERQGERGGQGLYIHNGWLTDGTQVNTEKGRNWKLDTRGLNFKIKQEETKLITQTWQAAAVNQIKHSFTSIKDFLQF